jgi:hypothetical protein
MLTAAEAEMLLARLDGRTVVLKLVMPAHDAQPLGAWRPLGPYLRSAHR